jgi:uncharacterized protein YeaO (DUF488 family)
MQGFAISAIQIERVYEPAEKDGGARILVDRIRPRGITKASIAFLRGLMRKAR